MLSPNWLTAGGLCWWIVPSIQFKVSKIILWNIKYKKVHVLINRFERESYSNTTFYKSIQYYGIKVCQWLLFCTSLVMHVCIYIYITIIFTHKKCTFWRKFVGNNHNILHQLENSNVGNLCLFKSNTYLFWTQLLVPM